jgi:hypothetical protein
LRGDGVREHLGGPEHEQAEDRDREDVEDAARFVGDGDHDAHKHRA